MGVVYASISFMQVFRLCKYFAGRRTSSVVRSMFWGNFVGLRWNLVEVRAHTGLVIKICSFYLLEIVMFITQTSSISPVSSRKHTPLYSTPNARKHIKPPNRGIVRRHILTTLSSISLVVGPARLSAQCFGESSSGSDGVWWRFCENFQSTSNQGCIPLCKRGSLLSVPPSLCPESCVAIGSIVLSAWINTHG